MALLLGVAMLPAGAIAMQVGLDTVSVRQAVFEESLGRRALQSMEVERGTINEIRELVRVLATSPALQQAEIRNCRQWLGGVVAEYEYLASISVSTEDGHILCSVPQVAPGFSVSRSALRTAAQARDNFTMGYLERGGLTNAPVLGALEPLRDANQRRIGFVGVSIRIDELRRALDRDRALDGARTAIVDAEGRVIVASTPLEGPMPGLPTPRQIRNHLGPDPSFVTVENGNAVVVPLHAPDLYIAMSWLPDQPAWRRWAGYFASVAAPLLIWLLAVAAGWFAIEIYVARPLSSLEAVARSYGRGEDVDDAPELASAPAEIRSLRRTLAAMAKTLRGRELRLVEALREERALLREVHHRVKNNLQMVASLLSIQARAARDDSEAWGLARAHDRVQLLALVHQRLYASGEVREVRLDELAAEIARQLLLARGAATQKIRLNLNLSEGRANADRAVPLAFMIGEGFSAALDALSDGADAELRVYLAQDADGALRFAIDADAQHRGEGGPAIGTRLIDAFARQLGASVGRNPDRPFMLWVSVPPPPPARDDQSSED